MGVVTPTDPEPPLAGQAESGDPRETVQLTPLSVAVNVWPATVAVSICVALLLLGGIVNVTAPFPGPWGDVALSPEAVQAHEELEVVTFTVAIPPAAESITLAGLIPYEQPVLPNCVMVNSCPPTLIVPLRCVVPVFCVSLKVIVPDPFPL